MKARGKMQEALITLSESGFDDAVKKFPVLVVDCWAEWCAPCFIIAPIIEELARGYAGKVVFGKLNVDEAQTIAMRYNVMSIPTLLFFKGGKLVDRVIGAVPKEHVEWMLKKII